VTQHRQGVKSFRLEEATIDELHAAIKAGEITCVQIVQHYLDRARAYNGAASALVTEDGRPIAHATGAVRAGAPLSFPTQTVAATTLFPDLDKYRGKPLEYGRMEATASGPTVRQQYGDDRRHPECWAGQRAGDAQHPGRAFRHLSRRVRPASVEGAVAFGRSAGVRDLPPLPRRARAGGGARRKVRT